MSRYQKDYPVTVIVPTYNEERMIDQCLSSLYKQSYKDFEIIVVDDGSKDKTVRLVDNFGGNRSEKNLTLLRQQHKGPGEARNRAANYAKGKILLFIDADMTFDENFIKEIIKPIQNYKAVGTDSQSGYIANINNYWARCWNMGKFAAAGNFTKDYLTDITPNKKDYGGVFRAILKSEFERAHGFEPGGDYTDDTSLAKRLGIKAKIANNAVFYHKNPDSLEEVWLRASWIGKGKNFTSSTKKKLLNLIRFLPLFSPLKGLIIGSKFNYPAFVLFKIIYDSAVWQSVVKSL